MNTDSKFPTLVEAINALSISRNPLSALSREQAEAQDEIRKKGARFGLTSGIFIPWFTSERRSLVTSRFADGGALVGDQVVDMAPALSNALVLQRLGCRVLGGLSGCASIAYGKARVSAQWRNETEENAPTSQTFDRLSLEPCRITASVLFSSQLLRQSPVAAENYLRSELATAIAEEIQAAAIDGNGFDKQPIGILQTAGIGLLDGETNGSAPTYEDVCALEAMVANANADDGSIGWVVSPNVRRKLRLTPMFSGGSSPIWSNTSSNALLGHPAGVTKAVPDDLTKGSSTECSAIIAGKFSELVIGFFGDGVQILVNPYTYADSGFIEITAETYVDSGVLTPAAFAAKKDALCSL